MHRISYMEASGVTHAVQLPAGWSLMRGAVKNGARGIAGDCGGAAASATCHIYVPEPWRSRLAALAALETDMLECAEDVTVESRLACAILMRPELDWIEVRLPVTQR